jgi:hypothetical protein
MRAYFNRFSMAIKGSGSRPKVRETETKGAQFFMTFRLTSSEYIIYTSLYFIYNSQEEKWPSA